MEKIFMYLKSLPPDVAVIVWDVMHNNITADTLALAANSPYLHEYEVVAAVAGGNLDYLEGLHSYCQELVLETMVQEEQ